MFPTFQKFHKTSEKRERVLSKITEYSEESFHKVSFYVDLILAMYRCTIKPRLSLPHLPGPSIYEALTSSLENEIYIQINLNCSPI